MKSKITMPLLCMLSISFGHFANAQGSCKYTLLPSVQKNFKSVTDLDDGILESQLFMCSIYLVDHYLTDKNTGCPKEEWGKICTFCKDVSSQITIRARHDSERFKFQMEARNQVAENLQKIEACTVNLAEPIKPNLPKSPSRATASEQKPN